MTEVHFYQPEVPLSIWSDRVGGRAMTEEERKELVERLRATWANSHNKPWNPDGAEAADRIEDLAAENERLRGALDAIRKTMDSYRSQMKFCDIEALVYFREFDRRIEQSGFRAALGETQ